MRKKCWNKSLLSGLVLLIILLLAACGGDEYAGDTNTSEEESAPVTEEVEETDDNEIEDSTEGTEPTLEIIDSTGDAWEDSIGTIWVHSSAIYENTGDIPVEIGETQMNFRNTEEDIMGTSSMIYAVPRVVAPGEQAYISESTILDGATDAAQYQDTTYNFSFDVTEEDANHLEVSGVNGIPSTDGFSTPYKVTGIVTNTTEELQDDIRISAALLAEDGSLLGVLQGNVSVGVNSGSEAGFELSYPEVPADVAEQVAEVEVKAYGWSW